jgi:UPF0755 protein
LRVQIKLFLLLIIGIILYFIFPRVSDKLIYIPSSEDKYAFEAIEYQNTPISSADFIILSFLGVKEGWVRVKTDTNLFELYNIILQNKREKTRKMVMYGGESIESFAKKIAKQAKLDSNKILNKYREIAFYKEGDIIARKYNIPFNTTEGSTIAYMVYKGHSIYRDLIKNRDFKLPSNEFKKYLIIASIIEKETQNYKEMPLISAVIHNRLKNDMKLQLDATLNYGKRAHIPITPKIIKSDNSKYNTYKHKGLPPEPICSPSATAFRAALNPAKVDYLYFVKRGNKHTFSKEYKEHTKKVAIYKSNLDKNRRKRVYRVLNSWVKLNFPTPYPKFNFSLPIK